MPSYLASCTGLHDEDNFNVVQKLREMISRAYGISVVIAERCNINIPWQLEVYKDIATHSIVISLTFARIVLEKRVSNDTCQGCL